MLSRGRCWWCSLQGLCIWESPGIRDRIWRLTKCITGSTSLHLTEFCPSCIYLTLFLHCCFICVLKAERRQDKASLLVLTRRAQRSQPWPAGHTSPGEHRWGPDLIAEHRLIKITQTDKTMPWASKSWGSGDSAGERPQERLRSGRAQGRDVAEGHGAEVRWARP